MDKIYKFTGYTEMAKDDLKKLNISASALKQKANESNAGEWLGHDKENNAELLKYPFSDGYALCILDINTDEVFEFVKK